MLLAEILDPAVMFFMGLLILLGVGLRHRAVSRARHSQQRNVVGEVRQELGLREQGPLKEIRRMEVRLHDYSREVESRVLTTMEILDQLVLDADREIAHLEELLRETGKTLARPHMQAGPDIVQHAPGRGTAQAGEAMLANGPTELDEICRDDEPYPGYHGHEASAGRVPTAEERRMMRHLYQAGFSVAELTKTFRCTVETVQAILRVDTRGDQAEAA